MRFHEERKQETRRKVLMAAAEEIRATGPERISVAGVMAKVGLTQGGFYAHFESKDDLIAKTVPFMFDDAYGHFLRHTQGAAPALALSNFVERYLSVRHRDDPGRGCPMPTLSGELSRLPATREAFAAGAARITKSIAELIAQFQPEHAAETAASVLAEMVGAIALSRAIDDDAQSRAVLGASRAALRRRLRLPEPQRSAK